MQLLTVPKADEKRLHGLDEREYRLNAYDEMYVNK